MTSKVSKLAAGRAKPKTPAGKSAGAAVVRAAAKTAVKPKRAKKAKLLGPAEIAEVVSGDFTRRHPNPKANSNT